MKENRTGGAKQAGEEEAAGLGALQASPPPRSAPEGLLRSVCVLSLPLPWAYFLLRRVEMLFNLPGRRTVNGSAPSLSSGR